MAVIDNLRVSEEAFSRTIQSYETHTMAMENAYLSISNEVRVLDGTYHGAASEKFKSQFDALYQNLKQNRSVMDNVIAKLKEALSTYQDIEEQAKNVFSGLDTGTQYL